MPQPSHSRRIDRRSALLMVRCSASVRCRVSARSRAASLLADGTPDGFMPSNLASPLSSKRERAGPVGEAQSQHAAHAEGAFRDRRRRPLLLQVLLERALVMAERHRDPRHQHDAHGMPVSDTPSHTRAGTPLTSTIRSVCSMVSFIHALLLNAERAGPAGSELGHTPRRRHPRTSTRFHADYAGYARSS